MEEIIQDVIEMATTTLEQEDSREESREESREDDVAPPPVPSTEIAPLPPNIPMLDEEAEEKNTNEEETFEDDEDFMSARPAVPEEEESEESRATSLQETSSIQESSPVGLEKTTTVMSADMEHSETKEKAKEETDFGEIRTLDLCGFSEEMIRLAAEGKSRNNGGLNKFDVGVVLETNQESSDGTRKQLNKRLLQLLNDVPFDVELENASDVASEISSSSVPDLVVDFETKREQRSRGPSVEDLFESRFDEDVAQPNPTPTVQ